MGKIKDHTIRHKHGKPCRDKILQKFKWEEKIMTEIDWESNRQVVQQIKPQQYVTTAKRHFRWQAVNEQQHRFFPNSNPTDKCPICKVATETQEHVYMCCHWSSRKEQDKQLALLLQWMKTKKTTTLT